MMCVLCGREKFEKKTILFESIIPDYSVCLDCIRELYKKYDNKYKETGKFSKYEHKLNHLKPSTIKRFLDQYIINQEQAKKVLSVAIYNHYKMIELKEKNKNFPPEISKSNIIIVGRSGTGKTAMLSRLSKILKVPFTIVDATSITESGYVGNDVEICIRQLIDAAGGNVELAQKGIVYIDEVDKISRKGENLSTTGDPGHEGTQQALLKLIEGSVVDVPEKGQRKHPNASTIKVNTENILFIAGGSFEQIEKIIAKRKNKNSTTLGIEASIEDKKVDLYNEMIHDVQVEDLKAFGMLPEFLGRFPIICSMEDLDEDALIKILTEPKDAITRQYQMLLKKDDVELTFTDSALKAIAQQAVKRKIGARSLRSILENVLGETMFKIPDETDIKRIIVDTKEDKIIVRQEKGV